MAKCDQGYPCELCGLPVKNINESSLYLRYVLGEVEAHELFSAPERHLKCDQNLAQFIVHEKFERPVLDSASSDDQVSIDDQTRRKKELRITAGWLRLREVVQLGIPITEYPLPENSHDEL